MWKNRNLKVFLTGNKLNLVLAVLGSLFYSASMLEIASVLEDTIVFISGQGEVEIGELLIRALVTVAVMWLAVLLRYYYFTSFCTKAVRSYRNSIFEQIMRKPIGCFLQENTSIYLSVLTNDVAKIKEGFLERIPDVIEIVACFTGAIIFLMMRNALLALISVALSIIPLLFSMVVGKKMPEKEKKLSEANSAYVEDVKDSLSGFMVIKNFKAEERVICKHTTVNSLAAMLGKARDQSFILVNGASHLLGNVSQLSIFFLCAYFASANIGVTAGTAVFFLQMMNYIISPVTEAPPLLSAMKAALVLVESHKELLHKHVEEKGRAELSPSSQGINVRDLSFSYDTSAECFALKKINVSFGEGQCWIIIGESGSGKTTLLHVLAGIHKGYTGNVKYGENELSSISAESLYDRISLIQQNVFIFNDTIENNITMFGEYEKNNIEQAISTSGLDEVIAEKGKEYLCGEGGCLLSGGERQRIAIARSVLRNYKILLIDEATSALDAETSRRVNQSILDLKGVTRIIIAHKPDENLLRNSDGILVMKGGTVVECGNFTELMNRKQYFYSLYMLTTGNLV